jgi:hypothetical protein
MLGLPDPFRAPKRPVYMGRPLTTQADWEAAAKNLRKADRPLGPAMPTRREWRAMHRAARLCELRAREAVQPGPILSDNPEWCAFDYQPNRKPIPYRALTSTGHMQASRSVSEWAGGVLSAAAERQRRERIEGKQGIASGATFGHAIATA